MANIVEFVVKMQDLISGPFQKISSTGSASFNKIQQNVDKLLGRNQALKQSINDLTKQLNDLEKTRNLSLDGRQIDAINKKMDTLQAKKDRLTNSGSSGGGLGSFFRTGLAIAGIGSLAFLGKDIMQAGIERQMSSTALQTLLGKNAGTQLNGQLLDFAKRSIYGNEVFTEGKLMAGSGIKANNIMPVLSMIGDIAMGDKERMKSLALAFSEASTRGSLTGINERMFLQGGLFNPLEQLHKMTGESLPALKKDMEKGKISIDELVKSMQYATGPMGRWHDMMKKMQETPAGKWTAFTGTVRTLAGTIGLALLPALGGITDFLTLIINNTDALYGIAAGIGAMTAAWALYTLWTERAAIWQGILEVIAWWPVAVIGTIIGLITYLVLKYKNWGDSMLQIWEIAKNVGKGIYDIFKFAFEDLGLLLDVFWLKIKSIFESMGYLAKAFVLLSAGNFSGAKAALDMSQHTEAGSAHDKLSAAYTIQKAAHTSVLQGLFSSNQLKGLDFSTNHPRKGLDPLSALSGFGKGGYTPDGAGAGGLGSAGDTSKSITGGGVRNMTIIVQKFQDKTEIHSASFKESVQEVERSLQDMFERIVNSAATALS
jgi:hypothetical protein